MKTRWLGVAGLGSVCLGLWPVLAASSRDEARPIAPPQPLPEWRSVDVDILVEGTRARFLSDGRYRWVEGRAGQRFAFRIYNRNSFPVGVIPSADGQSLTADGRAGEHHPAYVIQPYSSETIRIWRQDLRGGRELVFSRVDRSVAARKGDTRNIGVLGVLVWQLEDRYPPTSPVPLDPGVTRRRDEDAAATSERSKSSTRPAAPAPPGRAYLQPEPGLGTGAGERRNDGAILTRRYRRVRVLDRIAIFYDDREGLRRAGVPLDYEWEQYPRDRRASDPFPADDNYRGVRLPD